MWLSFLLPLAILVDGSSAKLTGMSGPQTGRCGLAPSMDSSGVLGKPVFGSHNLASSRGDQMGIRDPSPLASTHPLFMSIPMPRLKTAHLWSPLALYFDEF